MSSRRTLILIGAVVIGGLAAFLTLNYVRGVESRNAEANQLVEVLVASGAIPKGTAADDAIAAGLVEQAERRRADLPVGSVDRNAAIQGQVAAVDLNGGEIITGSMFVSDTQLSGSNALNLDRGNVAVTISVDEAAGVAGLIQPGDSINITARVSQPDEGSPLVQSMESAQGDEFQLVQPATAVFQDVNVLAVGQSLGEPVTTTDEDGQPVQDTAPQGNTGLITVQLPPEDAVLLASVRDSGLWLTLNRPDYEPVPLPFDWRRSVFSGQLGTSPYPDDDAAEPNDGQ